MHMQHWPALIVALVFALYFANAMSRERPAYSQPPAVAALGR